MEYIIKDVKNSIYFQKHLFESSNHWVFDKDEAHVFENKWEANKIMRTLSNKRNFKYFVIERLIRRERKFKDDKGKSIK